MQHSFEINPMVQTALTPLKPNHRKHRCKGLRITDGFNNVPKRATTRAEGNIIYTLNIGPLFNLIEPKDNNRNIPAIHPFRHLINNKLVKKQMAIDLIFEVREPISNNIRPYRDASLILGIMDIVLRCILRLNKIEIEKIHEIGAHYNQAEDSIILQFEKKDALFHCIHQAYLTGQLKEYFKQEYHELMKYIGVFAKQYTSSKDLFDNADINDPDDQIWQRYI